MAEAIDDDDEGRVVPVHSETQHPESWSGHQPSLLTWLYCPPSNDQPDAFSCAGVVRSALVALMRNLK